jgi:hypothetical protein
VVLITRALLAQSRPFRSSLRFDSLELWSEGLRPANQNIEARYIEGCRYRNNIIVSSVRKPYEAISVDNRWLITIAIQALSCLLAVSPRLVPLCLIFMVSLTYTFWGQGNIYLFAISLNHIVCITNIFTNRVKSCNRVKS